MRCVLVLSAATIVNQLTRLVWFADGEKLHSATRQNRNDTTTGLCGSQSARLGDELYSVSSGMPLPRPRQHRQLSPRRRRSTSFTATVLRHRHRRRPKPHLGSVQRLASRRQRLGDCQSPGQPYHPRGSGCILTPSSSSDRPSRRQSALQFTGDAVLRLPSSAGARFTRQQTGRCSSRPRVLPRPRSALTQH